MELSILLLIATFFVALLSSTLSGIAGGGGGFIMAPWQLIIGFTPTQIVASGSVGGSSIAIASMAALHKSSVKVHPFPVLLFSALAVASAVIASHVLPQINTETFQTIVAIVTILSLPLFFSRHGRFVAGYRSRTSQRLGYVVIGFTILIGSIIFTSTFSLLLALALPFFFGMNVFESTYVRRIIGLAQMIILAILLHEHIVWSYTIATVSGGMLGSYVGTHFAIRKGEKFARLTLASLAIVSAVMLLI